MNVVLGVILLSALGLGWVAVQQVKRRERMRRIRVRAYRERMHGTQVSARSEMRAAEDTTSVMTTMQKPGRAHGQSARGASSSRRSRAR